MAFVRHEILHLKAENVSYDLNIILEVVRQCDPCIIAGISLNDTVRFVLPADYNNDASYISTEIAGKNLVDLMQPTYNLRRLG